MRRTRLANERTYLAWLRTGLGAVALGLGIGKVVPVLLDVSPWPYVVLGVGFTVLGIALVAYGAYRHREVEAGLARDEFRSLGVRAAAYFAGFAVVLATATLLVIVLGEWRR